MKRLVHLGSVPGRSTAFDPTADRSLDALHQRGAFQPPPPGARREKLELDNVVKAKEATRRRVHCAANLGRQGHEAPGGQPTSPLSPYAPPLAPSDALTTKGGPGVSVSIARAGRDVPAPGMPTVVPAVIGAPKLHELPPDDERRVEAETALERERSALEPEPSLLIRTLSTKRSYLRKPPPRLHRKLPLMGEAAESEEASEPPPRSWYGYSAKSEAAGFKRARIARQRMQGKRAAEVLEAERARLRQEQEEKEREVRLRVREASLMLLPTATLDVGGQDLDLDTRSTSTAAPKKQGVSPARIAHRERVRQQRERRRVLQRPRHENPMALNTGRDGASEKYGSWREDRRAAIEHRREQEDQAAHADSGNGLEVTFVESADDENSDAAGASLPPLKTAPKGAPPARAPSPRHKMTRQQIRRAVRQQQQQRAHVAAQRGVFGGDKGQSPPMTPRGDATAPAYHRTHGPRTPPAPSFDFTTGRDSHRGGHLPVAQDLSHHTELLDVDRGHGLLARHVPRTSVKTAARIQGQAEVRGQLHALAMDCLSPENLARLARREAEEQARAAKRFHRVRKTQQRQKRGHFTTTDDDAFDAYSSCDSDAMSGGSVKSSPNATMDRSQRSPLHPGPLLKHRASRSPEPSPRAPLRTEGRTEEDLLRDERNAQAWAGVYRDLDVVRDDVHHAWKGAPPKERPLETCGRDFSFYAPRDDVRDTVGGALSPLPHLTRMAPLPLVVASPEVPAEGGHARPFHGPGLSHTPTPRSPPQKAPLPPQAHTPAPTTGLLPALQGRRGSRKPSVPTGVTLLAEYLHMDPAGIARRIAEERQGALSKAQAQASGAVQRRSVLRPLASFDAAAELSRSGSVSAALPRSGPDRGSGSRSGLHGAVSFREDGLQLSVVSSTLSDSGRP